MMSNFSFTNPSSSATNVANNPTNTNNMNVFGQPQQQQQQQAQQLQNPFQQQQQPQQPQQQQQQPQQSNDVPPITSLFMPKIFNDERDNIIGSFNRIQAFWGYGKAYYSAFNLPYEFNEHEQFNRFKTISYSEEKNLEDKLLFLIRYTDEQLLRTNMIQYEQNFKQFICGQQQQPQLYTVKLELKTLLPDNKALISITITENSTGKNIPDSQLRVTFNQPQWKQQLNQIFIDSFIEIIYTALSREEIEAYLRQPPKGIDERLWEQAKLENPDPQRFIPVPLIGFSALNDRFKLQEKEIQQQQQRLKQMIDNVSTLDSNISQFQAKFDECRRKHDNLSYRVLRKMIQQEIQRKRTMPIQADEDKLRADLDQIQNELNVPTKYQGCLNELMSQLRQMQCQNSSSSSFINNKITFDKSSMNDYLQFLNEENRGIMSLVEILKNDLQIINKHQEQQQQQQQQSIDGNKKS